MAISVALPEKPQILHTVPGRVRVHLPVWPEESKPRTLEKQLRQQQGVQSVQANPLTGNILIRFDPTQTNEQTLLEAVSSLEKQAVEANEVTAETTSLPPAHTERQGKTVRARIAVRGIDRDPHLAQRVIERLEQRGVKATANPLTGRVLVEFEEHQEDLTDLIAEIADMELPDLPGEDRPAYPLDPGPLIQSATRTVGATLGLALLATRRLFGVQEALPGAETAVQIAGIIGILQGIPPIRYGLRKLLGRTTADLLFNIPGIATLTLAGSPLGLAVTGGESVRLLTEVHARREAWKRHQERIAHAPSAQPNAIIRLETGERIPLAARVIEGTGTAIGRDAMPLPVLKGGTVPAGARLYGGPFVLKLEHERSFKAFTPEPRPAPLTPSLYDRYHKILAPITLGYVGLTAILTRSFSQSLAAMLLVNPRTAIIGQDSADLAAAARVVRAGVTIVGTRKDRTIRRPDVVILDGGRVLSDALELTGAIPLTEDYDTAAILARAAGVAAAAASPWGGIFRSAGTFSATEGSFDGKTATALAEGVRYTLGPVDTWSEIPEASRLRQRGSYVLVLRSEREQRPLGVFAVRPRLAPGVTELVAMCEQHRIELALISNGDQLAVQMLAHRAHIQIIENDNALEVIREKQQRGQLVFFVSDNISGSAGFAASDLAIGLTDDRARFPARADLLAPDLNAVAAIVEAGVLRNATARDAVWLSVASNVVGIIWGLRGIPGVAAASRAVYITALAALADGWYRFRGGKRANSTISRMVDPRPERWGRRSVNDIVRVLNSSETGLSSSQVAERTGQRIPEVKRNHLWAAILEQLRSPLIGIMAAGAGLSLFLGATGDVVIIGATILMNVAVGVWQENKANRVSEALKRIGTTKARVLRDNQPVTIPSDQIVVGDVLLLAPGDRIPADARVISSEGLEVDESALTGESLPVAKRRNGNTDISRIVLEGSDVTSGTGKALVVAVGRQTRMGATTAALSTEEDEQSPLGVRLSRMLQLILPISILGGATVVAAGMLWGRPVATLLATGATIALAGVPEGLPLLARVGEAGVARRLAERHAVVRRLSAVEALGRVNVTCTDKTGTMTNGRLTLTLVADAEDEVKLPRPLSPTQHHVLLTAALASPHPDAPDAKAHPTDRAVIQGAIRAGMNEQIQMKHERELSFDPVRSFHATVADGRLCLKGAPEALTSRCSFIIRNGEKVPLDVQGQQELLQRSQHLAEQGLRVLMVAEGTTDMQLDDPRNLTALGFVGISDPLRPTVCAAVRRCQEAGVKVIMITGDHPATARTIAREAGLLNGGGEVITATEIAEFQNGELDARLKNAVVIARATPLDKLRIIESLQRHGHIVAMTGDGVNDAPALRLANVGVAMGASGTEVARQTADVVITDDDFSTLVESFVEGRSFWRNIRRALGLLLGGNLGELGLVVAASLLGVATPMTARQILAVNAITDILPALAVALQKPEHRNLAGLSREGASAMDATLRNEVLRRGIATTVPALASYLIMLGSGMLPEARSVAFASIVATQLAQTLEAGRAEGSLTPGVLAAVGGSVGVMFAAFTIPALRTFLQLTIPSPLGWGLIGVGAISAVLLNRLLASPALAQLKLSAPALQLPAPRSTVQTA